MSSTTRRGVPAAKYNEWSHSDGAVRCVCVGALSGQLLAAGGEDAVARVYHIRRPTELAALHGNKKAVVTVSFNPTEYHLLTGTEAGMLSLFDLSRSKLTRQMAAHKTAVAVTEWHPLNDMLVASGGADTHIKLWDTRSGVEYVCYKGHEKGITALKFTPDGRSLASGAADGRIMIWDLTAGKKLHEFEASACHRGAVTSLDFHPEEFMLASTGADHLVRYWKVDPDAPLGLAALSPSDTSAVRVGRFTPDGKGFAAATNDHLKIWSVPSPGGASSGPGGGASMGTGASRPRHDPGVYTVDMLEVPWGGIASMWIGANVRPKDTTRDTPTPSPLHMVAAAINGRSVSVWGVDMTQLAPMAPTPLHAYAMPSVPSSVAPIAAVMQARASSGAAGTAPTQKAAGTEKHDDHRPDPSTSVVRPSSPPQAAAQAGTLSGHGGKAAPQPRVGPTEGSSKEDDLSLAAPPLPHARHQRKPSSRRQVAVASIDLADMADDEDVGPTVAAEPAKKPAARHDARAGVARAELEESNSKYSDEEFEFDDGLIVAGVAGRSAAAAAAAHPERPSEPSKRPAPESAVAPLDAIQQAIAQAQAAAAVARAAVPAKRTGAVVDALPAPAKVQPTVAPAARAEPAVPPAHDVNVKVATVPGETAPSIPSSPIQTPKRVEQAPAPESFTLAGSQEAAAPPPRQPARTRPSTRQRAEVPQPIDTSVTSVTSRIMRGMPETRRAAPLVPSMRDKPIGLDFAQFLPANSARGFGMSRIGPLSATSSMRNTSARTGSGEVTDVIAARLRSGHTSTNAQLQQRLTAVSQAGALWRLGDVKGTVTATLQNAPSGDRVVGEDFLRAIRISNGAFNLETASCLLENLAKFLKDSTVERAGPVVHVAKATVAAFAPVIKSTADAVQATPPVTGVELSLEDRWERCKHALQQLRSLRTGLGSWLRAHPDAGTGGVSANVGAILSDARGLEKTLIEWEATLPAVAAASSAP